MPTITLNKKDAERCIAKVNEALRQGYKPPTLTLRAGEQGAISVAAAAMGMKRTTFQSRIRTAKLEHKIEPDWSIYKVPTQEERIAAVQEKSLVEDLLRKIDSLEDEIANTKTVREHVFELAEVDTTPPEWTVNNSTSSEIGTPILMASDLQWGETIAANEMAGVNEFNIKIAEKRYKELISRACDLCFRHMVNPKYPGIIYIRGGDMISGGIHADLRETDELGAIGSMRSLVKSERAGIELLAEKFGKVHVLSVPGNHGRNTLKPQSKRAAEENYDILSAYMLETAFEDDDRVSFITTEGVDILFPVYGYNFLLTHGDRIGSRGGEGFIGPGATIARGMKRIVDQYAAMGQMIDWILCGHFHTRLELEYGFSNGCLSGYSQYARDGRMRPAQAEQWLIFCHPRRGITCRWPIQLTPRPKQQITSADLSKFR